MYAIKNGIVLFAYLQDRDEHIGNTYLSGGIEHGSKGNQLL